MNLPLSVCNFSGICNKLGFDKPLLFPQSLIQEMMFLDQSAHQFPARVCREFVSSQVKLAAAGISHFETRCKWLQVYCD